MSCRSASTSTSRIVLYTSATEFLEDTETYLNSREQESNIILAHALKHRNAEKKKGSSSQTALPRVHRPISFISSNLSDAESSPSQQLYKNIWLGSWSQGDVQSAPTLDFAVSCLDSYLGKLPVFIHSQHSMSHLDPVFLHSRMRQIAKRLYSLVPASRVFSVFG
jgi:hypothetical protein